MKKSIYIVVSFLVTSLITSNNLIARAEINTDPTVFNCDTTERSYVNWQAADKTPSLDGPVAFSQSMGWATSLTAIETSMFPDDYEKCVAASAQYYAQATNRDLGKTIGENCQLTERQLKLCQDIGYLPGPQTEEEIAAYNNSIYSARGSLAGITQSLIKTAESPAPLNLAYFFKENSKKIPIIKNTAYAQSSTQYSGPFIEIVYQYWNYSRNLAYGLMAIIMMVLGILIISSKTTGPKVAITVQQAIPQVVIVLLLITLSYPIGATASSLSWGLLESSVSWAETIFEIDETYQQAQGMSWWEFFTNGDFIAGVLGLILRPVLSIVKYVYYLLLIFKVLTIYIKLLLNIIAAPLIFTIGALPGKFNNITDWFKQLGAAVVSIPITMLAFNLVIVFGNELSMEFAQNVSIGIGASGDAVGGIFATVSGVDFIADFVAFVLPIFIVVKGVQMVKKIPDYVEKSFGVSTAK